MEIILYLFLALVISGSMGTYFIPLIIYTSKKRRLFDVYDSRKLHTKLISRLGGLSFMPSIIIAFCVVWGIMLHFHPEILSVSAGMKFTDVFFFLAGMILIALVGLIDDLINMSYKTKFIFLFIAATLLVIPSNIVTSFEGICFVGNITPLLSIPITIVLIVLISNSYNLIDGVDGLCSGLAIVSLSTLFLLFYNIDFTSRTLLCASAIGVVVVFFSYNVFGRRMKVFMGDSGSLVLGYIITYLCLEFVTKSDYYSTARGEAFIIAIGLVFLPVIDTVRVFGVRILKGKSPFLPDKNHIHHKFIALGFSHFQCMLSLVSFQVLIIVTNILLAGKININLIILIDIVLVGILNTVLNMATRKKESSISIISDNSNVEELPIENTLMSNDNEINDI